jgi:hypothetical protein
MTHTGSRRLCSGRRAASAERAELVENAQLRKELEGYRAARAMAVGIGVTTVYCCCYI